MARIVIDPGHGQGDNLGVLGYREGTMMWHLGQYLQTALEARGHVVANTRPYITNEPPLSDRGVMAKGHDLFLSLHSNANSNGEIRGASIYDSVSDKKDVMEQALVATIASVMGTKNNGVKHRESNVTSGVDYYGVLRSAVKNGCPDAMLVEHGYHTNQLDATWLLNHDNLRKLAEAEADCITLYYTGHVEDGKVKIGIVQVNTVLNVRSAPSADSDDIGDLLNGAPVLILGTENGWHKIQWADSVAYVSEKYVGIYNEVSIPAPDYLATINEKDEKITFLTNEVFASQERYKAAELLVQTAEQERDNYRNELVTISGIIKKYEV